MKISNYLLTNSQQSSMRLVFLMCALTACFISISSTIFYFILMLVGKQPIDITAIGLLVGVLLGAATAGKVGQAISESKTEQK